MTFDAFLKSICGMSPCQADSCLYTRYQEFILEYIIFIYVYDILIMTRKTNTLMKAKEKLNKRFHMKDMGSVKWFLGIIIDERQDGMYMTQTSYV